MVLSDIVLVSRVKDRQRSQPADCIYPSNNRSSADLSGYQPTGADFVVDERAADIGFRRKPPN
jgi:hypothetical protein